jgi:hypothetical protein
MPVLTASTLVYAFFGGLLPALLWLWFFNHEDPHPEPRGRLIETFIAGMITVFIAMAIQNIIQDAAGDLLTATKLFDTYEKEDQISFAFKLVFQSDERTLSDKEVNEQMQAVEEALEDNNRFSVR